MARKLSAVKKQAQTASTKASPAVSAIQAMLRRPEMDLIAEPLKSPLQDRLEYLEEVLDNARDVIAAADDVDVKDLPEIAELAAVSEAIAMAKKHMAICTGMMAAIAKAK